MPTSHQFIHPTDSSTDEAWQAEGLRGCFGERRSRGARCGQPAGLPLHAQHRRRHRGRGRVTAAGGTGRPLSQGARACLQVPPSPAFPSSSSCAQVGHLCSTFATHTIGPDCRSGIDLMSCLSPLAGCRYIHIQTGVRDVLIPIEVHGVQLTSKPILSSVLGSSHCP